MPSPSTIAMTEEQSGPSTPDSSPKLTRQEWIRRSVERAVAASPLINVEVVLRDLNKSADALEVQDPQYFQPEPQIEKILRENLAASQKTLGDQEQEIAALKERLKEAEDQLNKTVREHNEHYIATAQKVSTMALNESNLKGAMALLGRDLLDAQASRDRVLAENCALCFKNRKLRDSLSGLISLAEAARRFFDANTVFVEADIPSDKQTESAANASGELETLLVRNGF